MTHTSSRGKGQKAAAHADPEGSVGVFACLFEELSDGTWRG